jgi:hypothetical protein
MGTQLSIVPCKPLCRISAGTQPVTLDLGTLLLRLCCGGCLQARASELLHGLGFSKTMMARKTKVCVGGAKGAGGGQPMKRPR